MLQRLNIKISPEIGSVSAILQKPVEASALLVLNHGPDAGMDHPFLQNLADQLALTKVATLRFNYPFKENSRAPDCARKPQAAILAAIRAT